MFIAAINDSYYILNSSCLAVSPALRDNTHCNHTQMPSFFNLSSIGNLRYVHVFQEKLAKFERQR